MLGPEMSMFDNEGFRTKRIAQISRQLRLAIVACDQIGLGVVACHAQLALDILQDIRGPMSRRISSEE